MTRSEDKLRVGTAPRERGRARLRKYVLTENVETTVPVHAKSHVSSGSRSPTKISTRRCRARRSPRPSTRWSYAKKSRLWRKRTVPKQRVRLEKDTATEERPVSEEVRKERIESDRSDT
jgi:hypothetical protein